MAIRDVRRFGWNDGPGGMGHQVECGPRRVAVKVEWWFGWCGGRDGVAIRNVWRSGWNGGPGGMVVRVEWRSGWSGDPSGMAVQVECGPGGVLAPCPSAMAAKELS